LKIHPAQTLDVHRDTVLGKLNFARLTSRLARSPIMHESFPKKDFRASETHNDRGRTHPLFKQAEEPAGAAGQRVGFEISEAGIAR
jgi:hypothetical protein